MLSRASSCWLVSWICLIGAACQHAPDPAPRAAPPPATTGSAASGSVDPGERRAAIAGAHTIGAPGPSITLTTIDGETIDLAALYGTRPVYLKFWETWCIPCREQMPGFERIFETFGDQMAVIAVDTGIEQDLADVRAFRARYGLRMPIVIDDGRLAAALDLEVTPQHVLIGRDARIAYVGHLDGAPLDRAIHDALARPAPPGPVAGRPVELRTFRAGDAVEGLTATMLDGTSVALGATADGRPRALVLLSVWCESYLQDSRPAASQACRRGREAVEALAARADVHWLGIASNLWTSAEDVAAYRTKTGTRLPLAFDADGALFRAFGVRALPTVVLIDGRGRVARVVGPDEDLAAAVRAVVEAR